MLLEKIREKKINKQYVIDSMTTKVGYVVLRLPSYQCVLNLIKMVWNQLNYHVHNFNVYASQQPKVVDLIRKVCDENISTQHWMNYTNQDVKGDHSNVT